MSSTVIFIRSPIGLLHVVETEKGVQKVILMSKKGEQKFSNASEEKSNSILQIEEYFSGKRSAFDLKLDLIGTAFEKAVWKAAARIPYGKTLSYGQIAKKIGHPGAARAVGTALKKNPVCILVPCHRVLPKSGGIGEFALGKKAKQWLLEHEAVR